MKSMLTQHGDTLKTGLGSLGIIQLADQIPNTNYGDIIKLVVQVIVGISTLIGLIKPYFKKADSQG